MRPVLVLTGLSLIGLAHSTGVAKEDPLTPFLETYCLECHDDVVQKGDRRFDELNGEITDLASAEAFQEILDQLNLAEMPPEDEKQPSVEELQHLVAWLTDSLAVAREAARGQADNVVLRRLNRTEYHNTIRDLFSLPMDDFDPTATFPPDDVTDGFDTVGEGQVTSDYLMRNYLEAARLVADKAVRPGPEPKKIHDRAEGEEIIGSHESLRPDIARLTIKMRQPLEIARIHKAGVPADGEYVIRFKASAYNRKSRYADEHLRYNSDEPMRLAISIDSREQGPLSHRIIGEYDIPDEEPTVFEHRVWLDEGFRFRLHWANGPHGSFKRIMRKVLPKYTDDAIYPYRNPPEMYLGSGPELHVYWMEIEGPFFDEWPPPGFSRYFPDPPEKPDTAYLNESITRLATSAFRRPASQEELAPYFGLVERHFKETGDPWHAAKIGIRAVLASPSFLYLGEDAPPEGDDRINAYQFASRLAFFLWSSTPDNILLSAAHRGTLSDPTVLREQIDRMLNDPRSRAFSENFPDQWLHLNQLGEMPPDPEQNPAYYENNLEAAMKEETYQLFRHLLDHNGPIQEFVKSDYTFLNEALADHYGIPGVNGDTFQRVALPAESRRGGLFGHGSVLTVTSNGVETQPVVRGVWIMENLLGTPPTPPPPDVEPIEPDTRGVSTMRELMEKHRNNPTCFECHRKIDPLGLAMENFDHIGAWRDRYAKKLPIDASGEMPDGTTFEGAEGIRDYLLNRPDQFAHCLTEKLMVYGLGRRLSFTDQDDIDQIVSTLKQQGGGLRDLVHLVIQSEPFQSK